MSFYAKVILDSLAPCGKRLTTMEIRYPRFIHSEILTHRDRARNSASSRAIPWPKMMSAITETPVIPIRWGSEQKGMQTGGEIDNPEEATRICLEMRDFCIEGSKRLAALGVHKSLVNRYVEPWMWITVIMTATEWENFFRLRCHPDAEIHFQKIAGLIREAKAASTPTPLAAGEWHLPFSQDDERGMDAELLKQSSVARCARVSYLTHDGVPSLKKDAELFERLVQGSGFGHWSPHEHVAMATDDATHRSGPFVGWKQYRKMFAQECATEPVLARPEEVTA